MVSAAIVTTPSRLAAEPGAERCIECQTLYERKEATRVGFHR